MFQRARQLWGARGQSPRSNERVADAALSAGKILWGAAAGTRRQGSASAARLSSALLWIKWRNAGGQRSALCE